MGRAKALLPVPPGQTPLVVHVIERLRAVVRPEVWVIANDAQIAAEVTAPNACGEGVIVRVQPDNYPGFAALGGIATGLECVSDWALLVACDLPLVNPELCARLAAIAIAAEGLAQNDRWDAVVPLVDGHDEPMHALYHPRCLPAIRQLIADDQRRANAFLPNVRTRYVNEPELRLIDPDLRSFINVNTPDEWQAALRLLASL
jgi:molybdopterin-guanine dinucleotide biosynthesis protein A